MEYFMSIFTALLLTLVFEIPTVMLILRRYSVKDWLFALLLNLVTNTTMNCILVFAFPNNQVAVMVAELIVFLVEGAAYGLYTKKWEMSVLASIAANVFSLLVGYLLADFMIIGQDWLFISAFIAFMAETTAYLLCRLLPSGTKKPSKPLDRK